MKYYVEEECDLISCPTDHCVIWGCNNAKLEKKEKFWCCPKCGSSYGENPCRKMK